MVFLGVCRILLLIRENFDPGNCAGIFSPDYFWVGIHGFDVRGCFNGVGPFRGVASGDDVVILMINFDNAAIATIVCDDNGVGCIFFGW